MKNILVAILFFSLIYAQDINDLLNQNSNNKEANPIQFQQNMDLTSTENLTYTPIEKVINPDEYILGPGDLLGVNISSVQNVSLPLRINPVGEILIPSVGVVDVHGISLSSARQKISNHIRTTAISNAIISVTLLDIRRFKIPVLGAVHKPGYILASPVDRVYDAILQSGGVQKFAHPEIVQILRGDETITVKLRDYFSGKDLTQNRALKSGDIINVPFSDYANSIGMTAGDNYNQQIVVYGFVNRNSSGNSFNYFPGYTARDYIALAGGAKEQGSSFSAGNINGATIHRADGTKIKNAIDKIILPGDMIEVPPSFLYQLIGGDGIIRTLGTIASIASSIYIIDNIINDNSDSQ